MTRDKQLALVRELASNYCNGLLGAETAMDAIAAAVLSQETTLRTRLLAQLAGYGYATLAELEHLGQRSEVIAELARMRDDGLAEFWGPRYRITPAGRKLAETGSN